MPVVAKSHVIQTQKQREMILSCLNTQWRVPTLTYLVFSLYIIIFSYEYMCVSICRAVYRVHRNQNRAVNALGLKLQVIMSHVGAGNQTWVHSESSEVQ